MTFELPDNLKIEPFRHECKKCGKRYMCLEEMSGPVIDLMRENEWCWDCAYWEHFVQNKPQNYEVIDECGYRVFPFVKELHAGEVSGNWRKTVYILKRNGECLRTNDIWLVHRIPQHMQEKLPSTAWFVSEKFWKRMDRSQLKCFARGCLDRYHCYRYDYRMEFNEKPYNKVPLDWEPGSEHCPAYLPIIDIKNYDEYVSINDIIDESSVDIKNKTL